jgi:hypothetical protein
MPDTEPLMWIGSIPLGELKATGGGGQDGFLVSFSGTAELSAKPGLDDLLGRLHAELLSRHVRQVSVDVTKLEFMNSSCFKSFVSWIDEATKVEDPDQYRIEFLTNAAHHWQKRSLHALECFAPELITVKK